MNKYAQMADRLYDQEQQMKRLEKENAELKEQIEILKKCENCKYRELFSYENPCLHCQRCFASKDVKDQENVKDNWELLKEIKEK